MFADNLTSPAGTFPDRFSGLSGGFFLTLPPLVLPVLFGRLVVPLRASQRTPERPLWIGWVFSVWFWFSWLLFLVEENLD